MASMLLELMGLLQRQLKMERRIDAMASALEALTAAEANLETVVGLVIEHNKKMHADLLAALAKAGQEDPLPAVQAIADEINEHTEALRALLSPAAPADSDGGSAASEPGPNPEPAPGNEPAPVANEADSAAGVEEPAAEAPAADQSTQGGA